MTSIKFHQRASSSIARREQRIFVRIIHRRRALCISLPYRLYPEEWDKRRQDVVIMTKVSGRAAYLRGVSMGLVRVRKKLRVLADGLERKGEFTTRQLKDAYLGQEFSCGIKAYAETLADLLAGEGKERTGRCYTVSTGRLARFTGTRDIPFERVDGVLLRRFENSLRREGVKANTVSFYLCNLRSVYNKALRAGLFVPSDPDPFGRVFTGKEATPKRALSKEEMSRVAGLKPSDPALATALDLFLFSFYARGMAFADMAYLRKEDLADGVVSYRRKKTGQHMEVKVTPQMRGILQKLTARAKDTPYLLPVITRPGVAPRRQYESGLRLQNDRLRKIGALCGLEKPLTTHVARHSWASIAKTANLPVAVISEGLGHSSLATTTVYLSSFNRSVLDGANDKVGRLVSSL